MVTLMVEPGIGSLMTTDSAPNGFGARPMRRHSAVALADLTHHLTVAVDEAYWTFTLEGELQDAVDAALLRSALSDTPVLTGRFRPGRF